MIEKNQTIKLQISLQENNFLKKNFKINKILLFFNQHVEKKNSKESKFNPLLLSAKDCLYLLKDHLEEKTISPEAGSSLSLYHQEKLEAEQISFFSLGSIPTEKKSSLNSIKSTRHSFRLVGGEIARKAIAKKNFLTQVIDLSTLEEMKSHQFTIPSSLEFLQSFFEGIYLGLYQFSKYKKKSSQKSQALEIVIILPQLLLKEVETAKLISKAKIISEGVALARNLVNEPPNVLHTEKLATIARDIAKSLKVNCKILNKPQLQKLNINALLAVNSGSKHEAKMIILDNKNPKNKKAPVFLIIGKGVLFDSGGLSLKPPSSMVGMQMDMAGGAAVLAAFEALVKLNCPARIVAIIPTTDNMTGSAAMKVNDIIKTYSGKTVEVLNTDAEGRLILCDALSYGIKEYQPNYIIDLATLTGACLVALGRHYAGLFTPGDKLAKKLLDSSKNTDEAIWQLPLDDVYLKDLLSDMADLKNIGSSYGGASTAAKFLEQFVPDAYKEKWAHLDIAPTMDSLQNKGHLSKGGSGFGVRLLIDFITRNAK